MLVTVLVGKSIGWSWLDWADSMEMSNDQVEQALKHLTKLINITLLPLSFKWSPLLFRPFLVMFPCWMSCQLFCLQNFSNFLLTDFADSWNQFKCVCKCVCSLANWPWKGPVKSAFCGLQFSMGLRFVAILTTGFSLRLLALSLTCRKGPLAPFLPLVTSTSLGRLHHQERGGRRQMQDWKRNRMERCCDFDITLLLFRTIDSLACSLFVNL